MKMIWKLYLHRLHGLNFSTRALRYSLYIQAGRMVGWKVSIAGCFWRPARRFFAVSTIALVFPRDYANFSNFLQERVGMQKSAKANRGRMRRPRQLGRKRPRWTREEIGTLRRLYRTRSNAEIARLLGRTVSSIVFKGYRLGLSKGIRRLKEMGRENINKRWQKR